VVTGASSGIGRAIASRLASDGWTVHAIARRAHRLDELVSESAALPGTIHSHPLDVTDEPGLHELAERLMSLHGEPPQALIHNAGYSTLCPLELLEVAEVGRLFDVNVFSLLHLVRPFLPAMRVRGSGSIITISSIAGQFPIPFQGPYAASKAAAEYLTDTLRIELAPFGLSVVSIRPGPVASEFFEVMRSTALRLWPLGSPYDSSRTHLDDLIKRESHGALHANRIADLTRRILNHPHPRPHYTVPWRFVPLLTLGKLLPKPLSDAGARAYYFFRPGKMEPQMNTDEHR
jgi:NAD(P)-dependent dehydrogenase (short-subunit alcohol dehydrogenase family)